ncbi:MAG: hypothetical protein HQM14_20180 [SAR324 cluster bacterium]|nr:hypothetical protein [SAR324 cluster bacterium]
MQKTSSLEWEDGEMERLKGFIALSAEEKLQHLAQLNVFLHQAMPAKSKEVWEKLKQNGF